MYVQGLAPSLPSPPEKHQLAKTKVSAYGYGLSPTHPHSGEGDMAWRQPGLQSLAFRNLVGEGGHINGHWSPTTKFTDSWGVSQIRCDASGHIWLVGCRLRAPVLGRYVQRRWVRRGGLWAFLYYFCAAPESLPWSTTYVQLRQYGHLIAVLNACSEPNLSFLFWRC